MKLKMPINVNLMDVENDAKPSELLCLNLESLIKRIEFCVCEKSQLNRFSNVYIKTMRLYTVSSDDIIFRMIWDEMAEMTSSVK